MRTGVLRHGIARTSSGGAGGPTWQTPPAGAAPIRPGAVARNARPERPPENGRPKTAHTDVRQCAQERTSTGSPTAIAPGRRTAAFIAKLTLLPNSGSLR